MTAASVSFQVPGEPVSKGRPRSFVRGGHVAHYTPKETVRYENLVRLAASEAMAGRAPLDCPLRLELTAIFLWPKSATRKRRAQHQFKTTKPDLDNIVKAAKDAMNGVVFRDDALVCSTRCEKRYGDQAGLHVVVTQLVEV